MGGKAAALAELSEAGLRIPPWFVISASAFTAQGNSPEHSRIDPALAPAIEQAMSELSQHGCSKFFAVRSSAVDEDGSDHSFAGQLESFLFVTPDLVVQRVADVWQSGFSPRVLTYRREHGMAHPPMAPAVLIQQMIDADVSGVAFAADPVTGSRSTVVVSAVFGIGTALVGGDADCDTYRLDRSARLIEQHIARKTLRHVQDPSQPQGVRPEPLNDVNANRATLGAEQLRSIVEMVLAASALRGRPQDIEWAIAGNTLYLLQSRSITSLTNLPDPDGIRAIWDNSNIAESYNGITTPLTFSFARRAYDGAYRQFCKLMKVPAQVIADNDAMFSQMLGLIRGRVYYNLLNWYRLLALLPGFSVNQRFMEQMMGVREGIPAEIAANLTARDGVQRLADRLRLAWSAGGLLWNHLVLARKIRAFYRRLNDALAIPTVPLADMRLDQLAAEFRKLESRLVTRWDAPLINDFLAMVFFGVLGRLCDHWCGQAGHNLQNDLISDEGGIISVEPAFRITEMGKLAAAAPLLVDTLCTADAKTAEAEVGRYAGLEQRYRQYLEKFGDRCLEELKLESTTLVDDPLPLLRSIGHTARRLADPSSQFAPFRPRQAAEQQVAAALREHPVRRRIFAYVLHHARGRVRDRENLRFERTRLFGRVRRLFVEIGRRLFAEGRLADPREIFFLTLDEIFGFVEGTCVTEDLKSLSQLRRAQFDAYRTLPTPAERMETRGAVYLGNQFLAQTTAVPAAGAQLQGTGCCPGIVRGPVRIITEPRGAQLSQGQILVAERTDPGWIMLFPAAAGILVERGSLLSHSAIVARELGIPAIVSIPNLTRALTDGQWVEMDGSTGRLTFIESPLRSSPTTAEALTA
jgi:pyruvate,water dikinase